MTSDQIFRLALEWFDEACAAFKDGDRQRQQIAKAMHALCAAFHRLATRDL